MAPDLTFHDLIWDKLEAFHRRRLAACATIRNKCGQHCNTADRTGFRNKIISRGSVHKKALFEDWSTNVFEKKQAGEGLPVLPPGGRVSERLPAVFATSITTGLSGKINQAVQPGSNLMVVN